VKLSTVTITGADDKVDPHDLLALSEDYPFVEWGVLLHQDRGRQRYPSQWWFEEVWNTEVSCHCHFSAHLCGEFAARAIRPRLQLSLPAIIREEYRRIQINLRSQAMENVSFDYLRGWVDGLDTEMHIIFQWRDNSSDIDFLDRMRANDGYENYFNLLYDPSGGRGIAPDRWPDPLDNIRCGYAGGLNPYNLAPTLMRLDAMTDREDLWIDVESGVRTDNEFDLVKVREFLEIASDYVVG
jgi:hypothetical protein